MAGDPFERDAVSGGAAASAWVRRSVSSGSRAASSSRTGAVLLLASEACPAAGRRPVVWAVGPKHPLSFLATGTSNGVPRRKVRAPLSHGERSRGEDRLRPEIRREGEPRSPIVDAGPLHMHHRPWGSEFAPSARLWVAREASARDGAGAAPTRRGLPTSAIRWRRASGVGGVNRRSDRQRRSGLALPSVALRKRRSWCAGDRFRPTRPVALAEVEQAAILLSQESRAVEVTWHGASRSTRSRCAPLANCGS